jgi:hypothetical protein
MDFSNHANRSALAPPIRRLMLTEIIVFIIAGLTHFEILFGGHDDPSAGTAETVLGIVLLAALLLGLARPEMAVDAALAGQLIALIGVFIGLFLVIVVGPRTVLDITYHSTMAVLLILGLTVTWQEPDTANSRQ